MPDWGGFLRRVGAPGRASAWGLSAALLLASPLPALSAEPATVVATGGQQSLSLTTTKAVLVTLPRDAADVLVANPAVAEVVVRTPRLAYLIGAKAGDTNAIFLDAQGNRILALDIRVEKDLTALRQALADVLPGAAVAARAVNGDVVLSGEVPSSEMADTAQQVARRFVETDAGVINLLKVTRPEQVLIQVRVTEMRRSVAKKLGLSLDLADGHFRLATGGAGSANLFPDSFGAAALVGNGILGIDGLAAVIEALEQDGYVKTLAEPNLTALSGETANFLAGGEFPIPVARDTQGRITLEFKQFGVGLKFTPVVLDGGRISMRIATEVSALSDQGAFELADIRVPGLTVRRAETTVEIPSGGSMVLGGLLRNDATNQVRGLPGLASLPVLGPLFRSTDFQQEQTELVVIAVPFIVRPAAPRDLSSPTDGFAPNSDMDLFLLGRLYERYPGAKPPAPPAGPFGYIVD